MQAHSKNRSKASPKLSKRLLMTLTANRDEGMTFVPTANKYGTATAANSADQGHIEALKMQLKNLEVPVIVKSMLNIRKELYYTCSAYPSSDFLVVQYDFSALQGDPEFTKSCAALALPRPDDAPEMTLKQLVEAFEAFSTEVPRVWRTRMQEMSAAGSFSGPQQRSMDEQEKTVQQAFKNLLLTKHIAIAGILHELAPPVREALGHGVIMGTVMEICANELRERVLACID
jgi:hypothetical protein